jgi:hypothetical protein
MIGRPGVDFQINYLTWETALRSATLAGQIYRVKQRVFKHPFFGWTWAPVQGESQ